MNFLSFHEKKNRGTFDFPIEFHYLDSSHPRYEMPMHWHVESELIYVAKGTLLLDVEGQTFTLAAGDCAFLSAGMMHGGRPDDCIYECLVWDFERFFQDSNICRERFEQTYGEGLQIQKQFQAGNELSALIEQIFTTMSVKQIGYEFITTGLLWQLIGKILQRSCYVKHPTVQQTNNARRAHQIKNVLRYIRSHYAKPIGLQQLAEQAQMTPKYFCRVFSQVTGRTPIDYLNYYRIECAAELLCTSDESATEIALSCGFEDLSYFIRLFKRYKGVSTTVYRKQHLSLFPTELAVNLTSASQSLT